MRHADRLRTVTRTVCDCESLGHFTPLGFLGLDRNHTTAGRSQRIAGAGIGENKTAGVEGRAEHPHVHRTDISHGHGLGAFGLEA